MAGSKEAAEKIAALEGRLTVDRAPGCLNRVLCKLGSLRSKTDAASSRPRPAHYKPSGPEANVLIASALDPQSGEPDYNAVVTLEKA